MKSLHEIGLEHGTDKATFHFYCDFYDKYFSELRNSKIRFLEIGVWKSYSMKMWLDYFSNAEIHGIDYIPNTVPAGAHFHQVNCEIESDLKKFSKLQGEFDIIIDDGGHTMMQQQHAIKHLWNNAKQFYVIEDLHTSFKPYLMRCNNENWPVTFDLVRALIDKKSFTSPCIDDEFVNVVQSQIDSIEVYTKTPDVYSNSVTCVIKKRL